MRVITRVSLAQFIDLYLFCFMDLISSHLSFLIGWLLVKRIQGVLPFCKVSWQFGTVLNSSLIMVVMVEFSACSLQKNSLRIFQLRKKIKVVRLRLLQTLSKIFILRILHQRFIRDERIGQITHLPENPEDELLKLFEDPRPRNIRRAVKEGIQVTQEMKSFSRVFIKSCCMQAIGGLSKSWDFEKLLMDMPSDMWSISLAQEGELLRHCCFSTSTEL